jgi:AcrR family transcriptional regulator
MRLFCGILITRISIMNKGELTRQRIVERAAPIFNQRGYAGCSMQDVMEATGLEKGGLYRHFSSKEELAAEAFRYALGQAVRLRTERVDASLGAIEQLRSFVKQFVEAPSGVEGGCPLMNTAIDADDGNPVLRELALEGLRKWKTRLSRVVKEGVRRGEIREGVEPRGVANTIIAALEGALMISRMEGSKTALRDAQASLDIMLGGISPR